MSTHHCSTLANETWSNVFSCLSLHDLASVSRISKKCQALAFPYLYRTVCLNAAKHLEALARRIESDVDGSLSLRNRICGIILDKPKPKKIRVEQRMRPANDFDNSGLNDFDDDDLNHLLDIVPKLPFLQYLSWETELFPQRVGLIRTLQSASLRSVGWWVGHWEEGLLEDRSEGFLELLKFTDLTHFTLGMRQIPVTGFLRTFKEPITACLMASPNLESLTLDICDTDNISVIWFPRGIIEALGDFTFPSLRTFRAVGAPGEWDELTRGVAHSPIVGFFVRHPQLHTVDLGCPGLWIENCDSPEAFAALFPSIRHFEAPLVMCKAIMLSSRAQQLESVAMLDRNFGAYGQDDDLGALKGVELMPGLRKLVLNGENNWGAIKVDLLMDLLGMVPNLEELGARAFLDDPEKLLPLLKLVPKLRELHLLSPSYDWVRGEVGDWDLKACVPALVEVCPLLRCIGVPDYDEGLPFLVIGRELNGDLRIFDSATR